MPNKTDNPITPTIIGKSGLERKIFSKIKAKIIIAGQYQTFQFLKIFIKLLTNNNPYNNNKRYLKKQKIIP